MTVLMFHAFLFKDWYYWLQIRYLRRVFPSVFNYLAFWWNAIRMQAGSHFKRLIFMVHFVQKKTTHALYNYQENNDKSWELKLQLTKYYLVKIGFFDVYSITATLYSIGYSSRM